MKGRLLQEYQRYEEAATAYKQAADMGLPEACRNISAFYYHGRGIAKDLKMAMSYAKKAAGQGDVQGMVNLAVFHDQGGDAEKARFWIDKAAKTRHWIGLLEKGYGLLHGVYGYEPHPENGFQLIQSSTDTGRQAVAFLRLAELYAKGRGVAQDADKAKLFLVCSYKLGNVDAARILQHMYKEEGDQDRSLYWLFRERMATGEVAGVQTEAPLRDKFKKWDARLEAIDPYTIDLFTDKKHEI